MTTGSLQKLCTKCNVTKKLNEENWYKARPTATHPLGGWQAYCRECWKVVNRQNKQYRKQRLSATSEMSEDDRGTGEGNPLPLL